MTIKAIFRAFLRADVAAISSVLREACPRPTWTSVHLYATYENNLPTRFNFVSRESNISATINRCRARCVFRVVCTRRPLRAWHPTDVTPYRKGIMCAADHNEWSDLSAESQLPLSIALIYFLIHFLARTRMGVLHHRVISVLFYVPSFFFFFVGA